MVDEFVQSLNTFYNYEMVETVQGAFKVFQSMTYGDMIIAFLLLLIIVLMVFKWIWEVMA